ncbi:Transcription elongation factor GreA [Candidatus Roizmanbacteria bacterium]|nr:Transcription elongation factor GreA [Candidatus Roizmanbacteria bacterium]
MNKTPFTKQGYENLVNEQKELTKTRVDAVANLKTAREMGDLSENAAYRVARSKLSSVDRRLRFLTKILDNAYIMKVDFKGIVDVGCLVTVETNTANQTYQIVNSHESDIANGKISYYSPVGRALIGKRVNDVFEVTTPNGKISYKIKEIKIAS